MAALGAEAGTEEQQSRIKKKIDIRNNLAPALSRLNERGIQTGVSWIIGYPEESTQSMLDTITVAAKTKHMFPNSPSDVFPSAECPIRAKLWVSLTFTFFMGTFPFGLARGGSSRR